MPRAGSSRRAARRAENLDILLGLLGFFAAVLVIATVASEINGRSAVGLALVLLADVVAMWWLIRRRRAVQRAAHRPTSAR